MLEKFIKDAKLIMIRKNILIVNNKFINKSNNLWIKFRTILTQKNNKFKIKIKIRIKIKIKKKILIKQELLNKLTKQLLPIFI